MEEIAKRTISLAATAMLFLLFSHHALAANFDLQAWIDEQIDSNSALAIAVVQLKDGEARDYVGGTLTPGGDVKTDASTQFEIGSITKAFTDLLLAEMVESGEVRYDTTIGSLLGDDFTFANEAVGDITLLQLATHTSGLPRLPANLAMTNPLDPYKGYDVEKVLQGLAGTRDKQPLGNHYAYSNFGVGVLGYLLGEVHGGGYISALTELVLEPLGLEQTGFDVAAHSARAFRSGEVVPDWSLDALMGAGALRSTTHDLQRFARIQLGEIDNPLAHDLADDREIVNAAGQFHVTRVWHVAETERGKIYWHNGGTGGFWSFFGWQPDTNEAIAVLVSGDTEPTGLGLRWLGYRPSAPVTESIDEQILGQYALNPSFGIGVYQINGTLVAQASGQSPYGLHAVNNDWYAIDVVDGSLHFLRENGRVVGVELVQNGVIQSAQKTANTAAAVSKKAVDVAREDLAAYVGEYPINASARFTLRLADEGLEAKLTGQPFFPIFAKGDDVFFYKVVDAELHFERDGDGKVIALTLHQGGIEQRAEKAQ